MVTQNCVGDRGREEGEWYENHDESGRRQGYVYSQQVEECPGDDWQKSNDATPYDDPRLLPHDRRSRLEPSVKKQTNKAQG